MVNNNRLDRLIRAAQAYRRGDLSRREFQAIVLAALGALENGDLVLENLLPGELAEFLEDIPNLLRSKTVISLGSIPHTEPENEDAGAHALDILVRRGTEAFGALDFAQASGNVLSDAKGDWFKDPWGIPEVTWLSRSGLHVLSAALITPDLSVYGTLADVPKSAHTHRPATILDPLGRLIYQAIVDAASAELTSNLPPWTYGWRVPAGSNIPGEYAHNNRQWRKYVRRISWEAETNPNALSIDVEDFFSSIKTDDAIPSLFVDPSHAQYLIRLVNTWNEQTGRRGLPQRSLASSVIANGFLAEVDAVVDREWHPSSRPVEGSLSAVRWMDDFWIFSPPSLPRLDIENTVREAIDKLGLSVNEGKTFWRGGESLDHAIDALDFTYELSALESEQSDPEPLLESARYLLNGPSLGRTQVTFLAKTALRHNLSEIFDLFAEHMDKLLAGIDQVCRAFREVGRSNQLEDWFVLTLRSSASPWVRSSLFELLPKSQGGVNSKVLSAIEEVAERDHEYMVISAALSYLSDHNPSRAIEIIRTRANSCDNPALCRSLALAGACATMERREITRILDLFPQCFATLEMLRDMGFRLPNGHGTIPHSSEAEPT
jgi:hypothetical protein